MMGSWIRKPGYIQPLPEAQLKKHKQIYATCTQAIVTITMTTAVMATATAVAIRDSSGINNNENRIKQPIKDPNWKTYKSTTNIET